MPDMSETSLNPAMHHHQHSTHQSVAPMAMPQLGSPSSSVPTFRRFRARHALFKVACVGVFLAALFLVVGVACPAWNNQTGLWMDCGRGRCRYIFGSRDPAWLNGVRALELLALMTLLTCLSVLIYQDVLKTPSCPDNKAVELLAALAGLLGLIGVAVFGAKNPNRSGWEDTGSHYLHLEWVSHNLNWAYGLTAVGSIVLVICSVLLACSRVKHASRTSAAMTAAGIYVLPSRVVYVPPGSAVTMQTTSAGSEGLAGIYPHLPAHLSYPTSYTAAATASVAGITSAAVSVTHGMMTPQVATAPPSPDLPAVTVETTSPTACCPTMQQYSDGADSLPSSPTKQRYSGLAKTTVPVCYIMNQGQTIPVYNEIPTVTVTSVP